MKKHLYKYLRAGLKSESGDQKWKIGEWYEEKRGVSICNYGFHASKTPLQALGYIKGELLAEVEVRGKSEIQSDKQCWSEMRLVKVWHWTKEDSVALAVYAAELVIDIFEKKYPNDKRPREAIEAAKKYLEAVTLGDKKAAARAADAADAAGAAYAAYAADAAGAAYAAYAAGAAYAAYAAGAAADAARAAYAAADAAYAAYAAGAALVKKLDAWFIKRLKVLKEYND